jgi:hypothetical protein
MIAAGVKRALVIHSDDSYGQSLSVHFVAAATRDGVEVVPLPLSRVEAAAALGGGGMKELLQEAITQLDASGVYVAVSNATAGAGGFAGRGASGGPTPCTLALLKGAVGHQATNPTQPGPAHSQPARALPPNEPTTSAQTCSRPSPLLTYRAGPLSLSPTRS